MHKFTAELLFFPPQGQPGVRSFDVVFMFISMPARVVILGNNEISMQTLSRLDKVTCVFYFCLDHDMKRKWDNINFAYVEHKKNKGGEIMA